MLYHPKFKSIVCGIVAIFLAQPVQAQDDAYVEALKEKAKSVNATINATMESIAKAIESEENGQGGGNKGPAKTVVRPKVARALFTAGVRDLEPVNELSKIDKPQKILFFFTELLGMTNRHLEHRWYYENEPVGIEKINPQSPRWRSVSRVLLEDRRGLWAVELVDENENVLVRKEIVYAPDVNRP